MSIKIENVVLPSPEQWKAIIYGMRNPLNSWEKSDTDWFYVQDKADLSNGYLEHDNEDGDNFYYLLGQNDLDLMRRLCRAGTEHRKFLRMVTVYVDITAPLYWWKEFDTYKVGTVANSCSTMHKITVKEFTLEDFSCEHLLVGSLNNIRETISLLNKYRYVYNHYDSIKNGKMLVSEEIKRIIDNLTKKQIWWQMIQLLPSSYNQKRTVMLNYEVLSAMYHQRKAHKLDEWREFCSWIETLPYSELITEKRQGDEQLI